MREFDYVEANLRRLLAYYARSRASGETAENDGLALSFCGSDYAMFNTAALTAPVPLSRNDLETRLRRAFDYFQARRVRWSCWICRELLEPSIRTSCSSFVQALGFHLLSDLPGMMAESLTPPTRILPSATFAPVADEASRLAFCQINSAAFDLPLAIVRDVYGPEEAWRHGLSGWVAFSGSEPVATAATLADEFSVGVYSVGVVPRARHRGFAETITRHAIGEANRHAKVNRIILQSSPPGYRLYRRLSFREVTRFLVFSAPETRRQAIGVPC